MSRPKWETYFIDIARAVATRGDCTRAQVGAVIVKDRRIMATGYNGAPAGMPGCASSSACPRGLKSKEEVPPGTPYEGEVGACIALHAEMNAVLYCGFEERKGATIYITREPCDACLKMLAGSGIVYIVTPEHTYKYWADQPSTKRTFFNGTMAMWEKHEHHG